jgi:hypothetical protein
VPIPLDPLAAEVAEQLAPLLAQDDSNGNTGSHFIAALNGPLEVIADAVREDEEERDGFAIFMDLDRAPAFALAWLAQFKGVRATPGLAGEAVREQIRAAEGLHRGTIGSLQRAAARHTASQDPTLVRVFDRVGGDPYATIVVTRTSDTPDPAATLADILSDKIIGEIITHVVSDAALWIDGTLSWDAVGPGVLWGDVEVADVT